MEKDKFPNHGERSLPPSGRRLGFSIPGNSLNVKSELLSPSSITMPPLGPGFSSGSIHFGHGMPLDSNHFSHDISRMPDNPPKKLGHRRAQSEILTLPDDMSFGSDLGVVGGGLDGPSFSVEPEEDLSSVYLDIDKFNSSNLSSSLAASGFALTPAENVAPASSERQRVRHLHSQSMDASTPIKPEMLILGREKISAAETRKAMSAAKLAELALTDPKRVQRILANRQSAARSKERKIRYMAELERKVQTLQTEAISLSAQLILIRRDTNNMTAENSELKIRLQTIEQQVYLHDGLNDTLKENIQRLKILTGQAVPNGGPSMTFASSFGTNQQFYTNNHAMRSLSTAQQFQQLQIHSHQQQQQHWFQPHLLQQFLQQQQPEQHPELTGDMKMRGSMPSSSPKENASYVKPSPSKD